MKKSNKIIPYVEEGIVMTSELEKIIEENEYHLSQYVMNQKLQEFEDRVGKEKAREVILKKMEEMKRA